MLSVSTHAWLWRGIFKEMKGKEISPFSHPEIVEFDAADVLGGIKDIPAEKQLIRVSFVYGVFPCISKGLDYTQVNLHCHVKNDNMIHSFSTIIFLKVSKCYHLKSYFQGRNLYITGEYEINCLAYFPFHSNHCRSRQTEPHLPMLSFLHHPTGHG